MGVLDIFGCLCVVWRVLCESGVCVLCLIIIMILMMMMINTAQNTKCHDVFTEKIKKRLRTKKKKKWKTVVYLVLGRSGCVYV